MVVLEWWRAGAAVHIGEPSISQQTWQQWMATNRWTVDVGSKPEFAGLQLALHGGGTAR